ncbi:GNAT family N-acetyltransferase [Actinoplanes sp. TBRC 11911]|uniref:GNAT family N-acetyltransferase n=1 Tax=Actinoplanes sp. TBRC 11911 TaxID=2729386 RepID=UPI001B7D6C24|nr:GNAT family N-acetyltransferase [Actinoplanes sp. TBRC 11911]
MIAELARVLQEAATAAFPPARLARVDGWWLRHADTPDWWNASVLPHGPVPRHALADRITRAERFYPGPAAFQISPAATPGLDAALTERGYRRDGEISLQTAPVVAPPPRAFPVRLSNTPDDDWFATWSAMHSTPGAELDQRARLARIAHPTAYVSVLDDLGVIAVGRAVRTDGWTGVYGMATVPRARGRGTAHQVLAALSAWAGTPLFLQVELRNAPALLLYARTGFTERYRYHFRRQTPGT